jgi:hypothetical protein
VLVSVTRHAVGVYCWGHKGSVFYEENYTVTDARTRLYLKSLKVCQECVESSIVNFIFGISILSLHLQLIRDSGRK